MYFYEDRLDEIKNPENVNFIKTVKVRDSYAMVAHLADGRTIPLSNLSSEVYQDREDSIGPFDILKQKLGGDYFDNFKIDELGIVAVNTTRISKLLISKMLDKNTVLMIAEFGSDKPIKKLCYYDKDMAYQYKYAVDCASAKQFVYEY